MSRFHDHLRICLKVCLCCYSRQPFSELLNPKLPDISIKHHVAVYTPNYNQRLTARHEMRPKYGQLQEPV